MGFTSMDSINYRWKIFKKEKIQQNLGLLLTSNFFLLSEDERKWALNAR